MTAGYSALFSAGLLAPSHDFGGFPKTPSKDRVLKDSAGLPVSLVDTSPIRPLSPLPPTSDSDVELDARSDNDVDMDCKRDVTPTQQSVRAGSTSTTAPLPIPRLRRRKSSLTINTSPMNAIRSPIRTAGAALQLQRHLAGTRSRSGSTTTPPSATDGVLTMFGGGQHASESTSLMGRLRSGSVGSTRPPSITVTIPGRIRRHVRRSTTVPGPAPVPPPTAPLPALPSLVGNSMFNNPRSPFSFQNNEPGSSRTGYFGNVTKPVMPSRERALSVSSNVDTIDEEMKEN